MRPIGRYHIVTHGILRFFTSFIGAIHNNVSKAYQYDVVKMVKVKDKGEVVKESREVVKRPNRHYQPRGHGLSGVKQNKHKKLSKVIDIEKNYNFRPYNFTP